MKKVLILTMILSLVFCVNAFAVLPSGLELTPTPEDYQYTDLSEHKTVTMAMVGDGESTYPDYPEILALVNEELAKFNTTLEITVLSWADASNIYPLILTGGDECDLLYVATWMYLWSGAGDEAFYVIDEEFVQKYMPYAAEYQDPASWEQAVFDGKLQGVTQNRAPVSPSLIGIRSDLAEEFGLSTDIYTWDDLKVYMKGIAEHTAENGIFAFNSANGDSLANNEITRIFDLHAVGRTGNIRFVYGDGSIPAPEDLTYYYTSEYYKFVVDEGRELLEAGCWSRSAMSKTETASQSFQNGTGAVISWNFTVYQYATYLETNVLGVEKGTATKVFMLYADDYLIDAESFNNSVYVIMASTKDPYRAAMVLDILKFNTTINTLIVNGIEGRHWIDMGDGYFANGPDYKAYTPNGMCWCWGLNNANWHVKADRADQNEMQEFCDAHIGVNPTMAFVFNNESVAAYAASIDATVKEYNGTLATGFVDDTDATLAEFIDHLNDSGLETYLAEYMDQYTTWYNSL